MDLAAAEFSGRRASNYLQVSICLDLRQNHRAG